ncbi:MAG: DNA repair protein RecN [Desulfuromonadales bacterium]
MLLDLIITNFAIIDRLEIAFAEGFNVMTGETGAGKSIILDAVGLLLGDRARPDLVRAGATEATVQAQFDLAGLDTVQDRIRQVGFAVDEELVLRRIVQSGGRSRAYINGNLTTLAELQPLAELLVTVCGQHEHQSLLQRTTQLAILDRFGALDAQLARYRSSYRALQEVTQQLDQIDAAERDRQQRLDFLRHQSAEIAAAELSAEEEAALQNERLLLQNGERLATLTREGYDALYDSPGSVCEVLAGLADAFADVAALDEPLADLTETLKRNLYELEDVASQLRSYRDRIDFEPGRLDIVEERLGLLSRMKRKYAPTIGEILALQEDMIQEIERLENAGETRERLLQECDRLTAETMSRGRALSAARRTAADNLATRLIAELADLAMSGVSFDVAMTERTEPGPDGLERLEFMVSLNPGEPLMPLARVASGGELSRLMLALKRVAPEAGRVPTIIFDEVDAGIGGAAATAVGRKLRGVSRSAQVLCVTHLPQVAAFADHHLRVTKQEEQGRTTAGVAVLDGEDRVAEMARMLGGAQITERTLLHARELIAVSSEED